MRKLLQKLGSLFGERPERREPPREANAAHPPVEGIDDIFEEFAACFTGRLRGKGSIALPERLERARLDYSMESLHAVDRYLAEVHAAASELPGEAWHLTVLWGGAYVGEVIRRNTQHGFRWRDYDSYVVTHPKMRELIPERSVATTAALVARDGFLLLPLNKIARFIDEGPENSTHFFASAELTRR